MANQQIHESALAWTDVDLDEPGRQVGYLVIPQSINSDAWGTVRVPLVVFKNGVGPTVFLMAGCHGDEYEGQIVLAKILNSLRLQDIQGRLIIMPAANTPAALSGKRLSPIDGLNLNRSFPGDPEGSITEQIAFFISRCIFPLCDWHLDLHSGGVSLDFVPNVTCYEGENKQQNDIAYAAARLIGAPYTAHARIPANSNNGYASSEAVTQNVYSVGGEFGGCGGVSRAGLELLMTGVPRFLRHVGVLQDTGIDTVGENIETCEVEWLSSNNFVYAPCPGLYEPLVNLGDEVSAGQECAKIHFVDRPDVEPVVVTTSFDGIVLGRRHLGRADDGSCLFALARRQ